MYVVVIRAQGIYDISDVCMCMYKHKHNNGHRYTRGCMVVECRAELETTVQLSREIDSYRNPETYSISGDRICINLLYPRSCIVTVSESFYYPSSSTLDKSRIEVNSIINNSPPIFHRLVQKYLHK